MSEGFIDAVQHLGYIHLSGSGCSASGRDAIGRARAFKALKDIGYGGVLSLESHERVAIEFAPCPAIWQP